MSIEYSVSNDVNGAEDLSYLSHCKDSGTTCSDSPVSDMDIFFSGAEPDYNYRLMSLIRSRHPLLFVSTPEENRFLDHLKHFTMANDYLAYKWDCVHGLQCFNPNLFYSIDEDKKSHTDPVAILRNIIDKVKKVRGDNFKKVRGVVFVLCDFYKYIGSRHDPKIERLLRELAHEHRGGTVIVTGPKYISSDNLGHLFETLHFPRPNRKEISIELDKIVKSSSVQREYKDILSFVENNRDELIDSVLGLTMSEIRAAYMQTIVSAHDLGHHPLDISRIIAAKKSAIEKNESLGYVETTVDLEDIGGLDPLINWIKDRKLAFSPEAQKFGIDSPRGVLLCGVPGMGKSLTAKGMAKYFGRPLLRLDLGAVMDSLVGESEANIREAISLAETLAPCVTGDARVFDTNGVSYTIDELMSNEDLFSNRSFYTYSFNESTLEIEKTRVDAIVKKPRKRETIEIITVNSHVRVTNDHQMMVIRKGKLKWVKASSIVPNDFLVSPKKLHREPIEFELKNILDETFDIDDKGIRSKKPENKPEDVLFSEKGFDPEYAAYIAGMIDASGFLDHDGIISFESDNRFDYLFSAKVYSFCVAMQSCFGIEPELDKEKDGHTQCYVYNEIVYRIIDYILKNLISFNDNIVSSYISGFIESSSIIQHGPRAKISFIVEESEERERLCDALNCIGIISPKRTIRTVFVSSQHEIDTLARKVIDKVKIDYIKESITSAVGDCLSKSYHVGYHAEGVVAAEESKNNSNISTLASSDIIGVRVISVTPLGKETVYDLSCEGNHNFFANNLLCHNCVLWVDEVEKALSAAVGKGSGDSGTTKRVISTFLTWMQEKKKSVFVVCTANNMEDIPPEFMRAGRIDETFFIDLPNALEREEILRIMLRLKNYDPDKMDKFGNGKSIKEVAEHVNLESFSGAEIEKAVNEGMFFAFKENRDLIFDDIIRAAGQFKPLAKMRSAEISLMREWAQENARFANTHKTS